MQKQGVWLPKAFVDEFLMIFLYVYFKIFLLYFMWIFVVCNGNIFLLARGVVTEIYPVASGVATKFFFACNWDIFQF
jgi:hypothetical protein